MASADDTPCTCHISLWNCLFHRREGLPAGEVLELLRSIHHNIHTYHTIQMATLQEVLDAQAATAQALTALAGRVQPPAATATDLDTLVANEQANKAAADAIDPAQAAA